MSFRVVDPTSEPYIQEASQTQLVEHEDVVFPEHPVIHDIVFPSHPVLNNVSFMPHPILKGTISFPPNPVVNDKCTVFPAPPIVNRVIDFPKHPEIKNHIIYESRAPAGVSKQVLAPRTRQQLNPGVDSRAFFDVNKKGLESKIRNYLDEEYLIIEEDTFPYIDLDEYSNRIKFLYNRKYTSINKTYDPRVIYVSKDSFTSSGLRRLKRYFDSGAKSLGIDASIWNKQYPSPEVLENSLHTIRLMGLSIYILFLKELHDPIRKVLEEHVDIIEFVLVLARPT